MNKIYSDQIEKALALTEGLKKNSQFLQAKGYDLSIVSRLEAEAAEMSREAEAVAAEEERLSRHRAQCHLLLDQLKTTLTEGKAGIKSRFEQDQWLRYGVSDKR